MNVKILINETQKRNLLIESSSDEFIGIIKKNYELVKKILNISSKQLKTDLQFLITWGASIGGMVGPINDFVRGQFPELNDIQISLILTGVISTYYMDNKSLLEKIYNKLTEEGVFKIFLKVIKKSDQLRDSFLDFINSLGITFHKFTNMMSYTFIIPVIPMIYSLSMGNVNTEEDIQQIIIRITSFGLITISGVLIKELVIKMVKRFKG